jgi:hypothetical protein
MIGSRIREKWVKMTRHTDDSFAPSGLDTTNSTLTCLSSALGSVIFGVVRLVAWILAMPSPVETALWRVFAIIATAMPLMILLWLYLIRCPERAGGIWVYLTTFCLTLATLSYVVSRIFLLSERFRSLYYPPPEAFVSTWTGNFPHLA